MCLPYFLSVYPYVMYIVLLYVCRTILFSDGPAIQGNFSTLTKMDFQLVYFYVLTFLEIYFWGVAWYVGVVFVDTLIFYSR